MIKAALLLVAALAISAPAAALAVDVPDVQPATDSHDFVNCSLYHIGTLFFRTMDPIHLVHPVTICLLHP